MDVDGRVVVTKDLVALFVACLVIFVLDLVSPPTLLVSVAYAGLVVFAARSRHARIGAFVAAIGTLFIGIDLAIAGEISWHLSDPLVSSLLSTTLLWVIVLVGNRPRREVRRVRFAEMRNQAEEAILESHADIVKLTEVQRMLLDRLSVATQTAGIAIWDRDFVTNKVHLDDSVGRVFGVRAPARDFADVCRVIHPEDFERLKLSRDAAVTDSHSPTIITDRFRIVRETDGALRHIQIHRRLFRDATGKLERIIGVAWDVTDEVNAAQALMEATEAAQGANRAKSALLANVSHEIRTPMNGIIGMTGLLLESRLEASQREYAETIRGSADSLLRVIDDILDFSKIEAGRMDIEAVPTDVRRTVEDVKSLMSFQAAEKHLALDVEIDPALPARVLSDPQRLRQCLVNLVGNAIKFTTEGAVRIVVKRIARPGADYTTRFEVHDTGIGIDADSMKRLFEPFMQADSSTTRNFGGTGLGLSIVKRFIEMMDGRVGVDSTLGRGSTFWCELPLMPAATSEAEASLATQAIGKTAARTFELRFKGRVLVVEDNSVNQKVARRILERLGFDVDVADNGARAIELYDASRFDLILMDMQMPVMDGLTATTLIRQREIGKGRTPIIALTANAMNGEYERCMGVGMDGFLTKPLNIERLCGFLSGFGLRDLAMEETVVAEASASTESRTEADSPPIDLAKLQEITGGDAEFTTELLDTFFASVSQGLDELAEALRQDDRQQMARIAHRLKGAAFNVHARAIGDCAAALESDMKSAPTTVLTERIGEIRTHIAAMSAYLERERGGAVRAA